MAASGDVTVAQDGHAKAHPYLLALVRWCVSCVWTTATILLHRLLAAPLTPITAFPPTRARARPAGTEHLHPEPRVHTEVLHAPHVHNLDVVFVHGLYGSLCNTWRQGEWRQKYVKEPETIQLQRSNSIPVPRSCEKCTDTNANDFSNNEGNDYNRYNDYNERVNNKEDFDDEENEYGDNDSAFTNIDEKFYRDFKRILPMAKNADFISEKFYNNTLMDQCDIVGNYDTQAKFVSDLFKNNCGDNSINDQVKDYNDANDYEDEKDSFKYEVNEIKAKEDCRCDKEGKQCEVGCGCVCDECYSPCWPRDWIKMDYPDARVISINYTSDPHLWRPLWIKENKRLRLHERAEQMSQQLLDLGVGEKPVIWVGHSKGGLFIKQIYCEAYEAYLKTQAKSNLECNVNKIIDDNNIEDNNTIIESNTEAVDDNINNNSNINHNIEPKKELLSETEEGDNFKISNEDVSLNVTIESGDSQGMEVDDGNEVLSSKVNEDKYDITTRGRLWQNSAGFMFYSVPHRGSPLADIKTPLTARSVELMEITKDCTLLLSLQERWSVATGAGRPLVRSLVESRRTLMSVLWLRIVSYESADPGIGAVCGVSLDHREICKPSSRRCKLYAELDTLIKAALTKCHCGGRNYT